MMHVGLALLTILKDRSTNQSANLLSTNLLHMELILKWWLVSKTFQFCTVMKNILRAKLVMLLVLYTEVASRI